MHTSTIEYSILGEDTSIWCWTFTDHSPRNKLQLSFIFLNNKQSKSWWSINSYVWINYLLDSFPNGYRKYKHLITNAVCGRYPHKDGVIPLGTRVIFADGAFFLGWRVLHSRLTLQVLLLLLLLLLLFLLLLIIIHSYTIGLEEIYK